MTCVVFDMSLECVCVCMYMFLLCLSRCVWLFWICFGFGLIGWFPRHKFLSWQTSFLCILVQVMGPLLWLMELLWFWLGRKSRQTPIGCHFYLWKAPSSSDSSFSGSWRTSCHRVTRCCSYAQHCSRHSTWILSPVVVQIWEGAERCHSWCEAVSVRQADFVPLNPSTYVPCSWHRADDAHPDWQISFDPPPHRPSSRVFSTSRSGLSIHLPLCLGFYCPGRATG